MPAMMPSAAVPWEYQGRATAEQFALGRRHPVPHLGADDPGADGVDTHPRFRKLDRQRAGGRLHGAIGAIHARGARPDGPAHLPQTTTPTRSGHSPSYATDCEPPISNPRRRPQPVANGEGETYEPRSSNRTSLRHWQSG